MGPGALTCCNRVHVFFRAPGSAAEAGSEALRFATSPAPATELGALRFKPFAPTAKSQTHGCPVGMSPMKTTAVQITPNTAAQAEACGGAMWQSEAPLSPVAGLCLSGESSPAPGPFPWGARTLAARLAASIFFQRTEINHELHRPPQGHAFQHRAFGPH